MISLKFFDEVFKNTNVEYKVIDKKIILSTELASVEQAHQKKVKVSGRVVDAAGEPVIGASVIEKAPPMARSLIWTVILP